MQPSDISVSCPACGGAESEIGSRLRLLRTLCISVLLTMPLFWNLHPLAQLAIASVLQFWPGAYFYKGAYKALRLGVLGMDFLVAVSTTVIYLHSACIALTVHHDVKLYFLSEGVLLSLILFGKYMECTSRYEASEAIRKLIRLQPETANVLRGGTVQTVDIRTLTSGNIVQVRSGERVPIDGAVLSGSCTVDESMLTGESELIPKCAGARMYCGTLCREGDVTLSCAAVSEQTVLAQIIAIVSAAQSEKAPVARLADKIATVFVPVVILVAAGVFCLRYFVLDAGNLRSALNCVCSTLVIACPCALGLATPTSIMTGSGRAAELGVLFRGGEQLETAYKTDTVVFDKTGTLTLGLTDGAEQLQPGAAEAVRALRDRGMELWMISGDKREKAERIAGMLGIENVLCEVRPRRQIGRGQGAAGARKARVLRRRRHQRLPGAGVRRHRRRARLRRGHRHFDGGRDDRQQQYAKRADGVRHLRRNHEKRAPEPDLGSRLQRHLHPARGVRHHQPLHCRGRDGAELQRRIIKRIEVEKI